MTSGARYYAPGGWRTVVGRVGGVRRASPGRGARRRDGGVAGGRACGRDAGGGEGVSSTIAARQRVAARTTSRVVAPSGSAAAKRTGPPPQRDPPGGELLAEELRVGADGEGVEAAPRRRSPRTCPRRRARRPRARGRGWRRGPGRPAASTSSRAAVSSAPRPSVAPASGQDEGGRGAVEADERILGDHHGGRGHDRLGEDERAALGQRERAQRALPRGREADAGQGGGHHVGRLARRGAPARRAPQPT